MHDLLLTQSRAGGGRSGVNIITPKRGNKLSWPLLWSLTFGFAGLPRNQLVQVVAIWTVGAKSLLIKQALDATAEADLIRVLLKADGPTHLAMPTATQYQNCCASYARCH